MKYELRLQAAKRGMPVNTQIPQLIQWSKYINTNNCTPNDQNQSWSDQQHFPTLPVYPQYPIYQALVDNRVSMLASTLNTVIVFVVCDYFTQWSFHLLLQLICTFLYRTLHPLSPSPPVSFSPSFYSTPSSLPLLPQLPRYQVTVHLSAIADPDIAKVTRLASLLPTSSTPSSFSYHPCQDLHAIRLHHVHLWYRPPRY